MSIDRINKVLEQLHLFSEELVEFNPPVVPEEVSAFEEKHGIVLPEDYKYLLSVTNGLSLMGDCILGIGNPTRSEDLESVYHIEHFECGNPMPLHLIPFCPMALEIIIALMFIMKTLFSDSMMWTIQKVVPM